MRRVVPFLHYTSRTVSVIAMLAGLALGMLDATMGAGFTCFDSCPSPDQFFPNLVSSSIRFRRPVSRLKRWRWRSSWPIAPPRDSRAARWL